MCRSTPGSGRASKRGVITATGAPGNQSRVRQRPKPPSPAAKNMQGNMLASYHKGRLHIRMIFHHLYRISGTPVLQQRLGGPGTRPAPPAGPPDQRLWRPIPVLWHFPILRVGGQRLGCQPKLWLQNRRFGTVSSCLKESWMCTHSAEASNNLILST